MVGFRGYISPFHNLKELSNVEHTDLQDTLEASGSR